MSDSSSKALEEMSAYPQELRARVTRTAALLFALGLNCTLAAQEVPEAKQQSSGVEAQASPQPNEPKRTTRIPLVAGTATKDQIFKAVAKDVHWIAAEVAAISASVGVTDESQRLTQTQVQDLVTRFPKVFSFVGNGADPSRALLVHNDKLLSNLSDAKSGIRQWLTTIDGKPLSSLTQVTSTWDGVTIQPRRIVVCMAGLHGLASGAEAVAVALHSQTNLPSCVFEYPNDGPLAESAEMLQRELVALHTKYPRASITLVTHSMGGLVSRAVLETPDLRRGGNFGVDQLIQVCPPNHGSAIAEYGPLLEGVEQISRLMDRGTRSSRELLGMIKDGFNEAPADLRPGSPFLDSLNRNPRNAGVRYTVLAGTDGPLRPVVHTLLGEVWSLIEGNTDQPVRLNSRVTSLLECDDLKNGFGDGVVSLKSARLAGIWDFKSLKIHHLTWGQLDTEGGRLMLSEITSRLGTAL